MSAPVIEKPEQPVLSSRRLNYFRSLAADMTPLTIPESVEVVGLLDYLLTRARERAQQALDLNADKTRLEAIYGEVSRERDHAGHELAMALAELDTMRESRDSWQATAGELEAQVAEMRNDLQDAMERSGSRRSDPGTSREGAADVAVRAGSQRGKLLRVYATTPLGGLTSDEARDAAGLSMRSCYWKRVSELAQFGYIEAFGSHAGEAGSNKTVYRVTDKGRTTVAAMG